MSECKPIGTPSLVQPLGTNANGKHHHENWDCASAAGMSMCLVGNACPEIQCAVHQCACFTHAPCHSHVEAVKRIAQCLKCVLEAEQGLQFTVSDNFGLNLFVDANFSGLWTHEDDQDPVCVKSRTGYVVTFGD